jgi:hypothetical protein
MKECNYSALKDSDCGVIAITDVLDIVHYLRQKRHNISENGTAPVFRWKGERGNLL